MKGLSLILFASVWVYGYDTMMPPPQCACSVFPSCIQKATTDVTGCVATCRTKPFLDQETCEINCNLVFQSVMVETRTCPLKPCSQCSECVAECTGLWTVCRKRCTTPSCLANCTTEQDACKRDSVPCAIPTPPSTPSPVRPMPLPHDRELIASLTQEALSLSDGVYFTTAPHMLPYKGVTTIGKGEFLQSPSGLYSLEFLENGDLGLFAGNVQLWQAYRQVNRGAPGYIEFDPATGVMRMYSSTHTLWWDSLTVFQRIRVCMPESPPPFCRVIPRIIHHALPNGKAPYELRVTDHGNVEIVDSLGKVFFETSTSNQGMLITDITAHADYATGQTTPDLLVPFLGQWSMVPVDVRMMFNVAAYTALDEWKIFSIHFAPSIGKVEEWVGATKKTNGTLSLLYIHVVSTGTPIQQYRPVQVPSCHRCWFHSCCSTHTVNVPRGFEADELLSMVISLRRAGFFALQNIIAAL